MRRRAGNFLPVWERHEGNDGYVSFELDPLLEDPAASIPMPSASTRYIELGKKWSAGHTNRMIKVPATPAGLDALEELSAAGVTLNVTLIFSPRQYQAARDAIWRGAQKRSDLSKFKSVYSIFVSRVDLYTESTCRRYRPRPRAWWASSTPSRSGPRTTISGQEHKTAAAQEMIFASTGTKKPDDPPWKYVEAFAGSDIETNPPATNEAVAKSGRTFTRQVDQLPPQQVLDEIATKVDIEHLEAVLMEEGVKKFADPQKALLKLIAEKRRSLG